MSEFLAVAIGIGLVVSLLFSEVFGLAAGGMVVPGYFALNLHHPLAVVITLLAAVATYFIVYMLSMIVIVYGKRRTVLMIIVGYLIRMFLDVLPIDALYPPDIAEPIELVVIGYIIPGLIAIWIDRQGLVETITALLAASVVVRLIMILIFGPELRV